METSWNVKDYPDAPNEWNDVKTISGKIWVCYAFETEVPKDWDNARILEDMYDNIDDYTQDLKEIDY